MLKNKKAYIWVSTVIYIALGMIVITIILTAGMPVINNLRDKNIALQTKDVMHEIDKSIRAVLRDGPGAQRVRDFDIGRGFIEIIPEAEKIKWEIETGVVLSAIDHEVQEGNLKILTNKTLVEKEYKTTIWLDYTKPTPLTNIEGDSPLKLSGKFTLVIRNTGSTTTTEINGISIPDVSIKEKL